MSNAHAVETSGPPPGWPRPPFDWPHHEQREHAGARGCRIDTVEGRWLHAFALDVDPGARDWRVAAKADGPFVLLSLARVARITLNASLHAATLSVEQGPARIPVPALECDYIVRTAAGQQLLQGRTVGHVDTDNGFFLFAAQPGHIALNRVLVPRAAHLSCEFGPTAGDHAASRWITEPAALRAALSSQRDKRIPRIGEALLQLGFVTTQLIEHALAQPAAQGRLGERLVRQGLLTPEQLQAGLAFKLGYPLVDLGRFPIDPVCARMLPPELANRHGAVPILLDGRRIVVAVEGPATAATLEALNLWPGRVIAPAFAPRGAILLALSALRGDDAWAQEAPWQ
jgi:hypothetical protein